MIVVRLHGVGIGMALAWTRAQRHRTVAHTICTSPCLRMAIRMYAFPPTRACIHVRICGCIRPPLFRTLVLLVPDCSSSSGSLLAAYQLPIHDPRLSCIGRHHNHDKSDLCSGVPPTKEIDEVVSSTEPPTQPTGLLAEFLLHAGVLFRDPVPLSDILPPARERWRGVVLYYRRVPSSTTGSLKCHGVLPKGGSDSRWKCLLDENGQEAGPKVSSILPTVGY